MKSASDFACARTFFAYIFVYAKSSSLLHTISTHEAKYMVPRDPTLKTAYRTSKHQRPRLKLHGIWCFGYVLRIAVLEENTYHGSALVQELVALALEDIARICQAGRASQPGTMVLVGDNTVQELKNTYLLTFAASLILHQKLRFFD